MENKVIKMEPRLRSRLLPYQSFKCREDVIKAQRYLTHKVRLRGQSLRLINMLVGHMLKVPGACSLSRDRIMDALGLSERQYKYALSFLTKRKIVLTHQKHKQDGKFGAVVFVFNPPNFWELEERDDKQQKIEKENIDLGTPYIPEYEIPEVPEPSVSHEVSHGNVPRDLSHGNPVDNTVESAENQADSNVDNSPKYFSFKSSLNSSFKQSFKRKRKSPTASIHLDKFHCSELVPVEIRDLIADHYDDAHKINQVWRKVEDVAKKLNMDLCEIPLGITVQVIQKGLEKLKNKQLSKGNTFHCMCGYIYSGLLIGYQQYLAKVQKQKQITESIREKEFVHFNWVTQFKNEMTDDIYNQFGMSKDEFLGLPDPIRFDYIAGYVQSLDLHAISAEKRLSLEDLLNENGYDLELIMLVNSEERQPEVESVDYTRKIQEKLKELNICLPKQQENELHEKDASLDKLADYQATIRSMIEIAN
jgi:hypothetical protein